MNENANLEEGATIRIRRALDKRSREAVVERVLDDGRVRVRTYHRAARGGSWTSTTEIVKPKEIVG